MANINDNRQDPKMNNHSSNNVDVRDLLYIEHENMLVKRGQREEELMKDNYTPIIANQVSTTVAAKAARTGYGMIKMKNLSSSLPGGGGFGVRIVESTKRKKKNGSKNSRISDKDNNNNKQKIIPLHDRPSLFPSIYYTEASSHASVLKEQGVVRIDNVLSTELADQLRAFVLELRADSLEKVLHQKIISSTERFADVLLRTNRCDLKIPLMGQGSSNIKHLTTNKKRLYNIHTDNTDVVELALHHIYTQSAIPDTIQLLFDKYNGDLPKEVENGLMSPVLYELASLISDPGSQRQTIHPDNPIRSNLGSGSNTNEDVPVLLTCFIALQDITADMGPTVWLPGTHTAKYHEIFFQDQPLSASSSDGIVDESPKDHLLRTHPAVIGTLKKGCCAVYDSRILHCGSANKRPLRVNDSTATSALDNNENSRVIFYFSFRNPLVAYPGNPASIRSEIGQAKITLQQLQHALSDAVQQKHQDGTFEGGFLEQNPFPWNR